MVCGVVRAWNLKSHQAVSLTTVWLRISIRVLKIDMKRYRQALAVNDSLRDTDRPGAPWGLLRPPGASWGLLEPGGPRWTHEDPGGSRRTQEEPGRARRSQEEP